LSGPKEVDDKDLILPLKPILRGFCLWRRIMALLEP
jgi:hypothetical protein